MAQCSRSRAENDKSNNNSEQNYLLSQKQAQDAIKIGEETGNYRLAGSAYSHLKWLERWKGDPAKAKTYLQKAIFYFEKPVKKTA